MHEPDRITALFAFNVGVELGQVAVALVLVAALLTLRRSREALAPRFVRRWVSLGVAALGLVWFARRL